MRRELILAAATLGGILLAVPAMGGTPVRPSDGAVDDAAGEEAADEAKHAEDVAQAGQELSAEDQAAIRAAKDETREWTVAVLSDFNGAYGSTAYGDEVHRAVAWLSEDVRPDVVISPGDMVAGQRAGLDHRAMWASFHDVVTRPLARAGIPFAISPGNHDASGSPAFWEERVHFAREWQDRAPQVEMVEASGYPFYYAFKVGPALFVSLDATTVGPIDTAQRLWLDAVLKAHSEVRTKIVFGHLPLHPVAQSKEHETLADEALEALLLHHGVDLYVAGHHHAYYPGKRGELGLLHSACIGAGPRKLLGEDRVSDRSVALVRYGAEGVRSVEAYRGEGFEEVVPREELPRVVGEGRRKIWRDDVQPNEVDVQAKRRVWGGLEGGA
ncbi:hypothetical protein EA187_01695 [Lujinxingia sediminis]|uniref:Calcineurin-like phosphoesterase domain-containing protein n=1 Tax=Lujinxingia sediminis TaxID=2480984 RepID=A0ABY0CWD3_9DELT|nr:metallophosphoesterase [Lujinxingia sediminis]RVU48176.1 hypothetical protein EA187_01695 [Lujinxingia sediminis]